MDSYKVAKEVKKHNDFIRKYYGRDLLVHPEEQWNNATYVVDDLIKFVPWWQAKDNELRRAVMLEF